LIRTKPNAAVAKAENATFLFLFIVLPLWLLVGLSGKLAQEGVAFWTSRRSASLENGVIDIGLGASKTRSGADKGEAVHAVPLEPVLPKCSCKNMST
jgi:hypothetical protein